MLHPIINTRPIEGTRHTRHPFALNDIDIECDVYVTQTHDGTDDLGQHQYRHDVEISEVVGVTIHRCPKLSMRFPACSFRDEVLTWLLEMAGDHLDEERQEIIDDCF